MLDSLLCQELMCVPSLQASVNELLVSLGVPKRALVADVASSSNDNGSTAAGRQGRAGGVAAPELRIRREIRREASGALRRCITQYLCTSGEANRGRGARVLQTYARNIRSQHGRPCVHHAPVTRANVAC